MWLGAPIRCPTCHVVVQGKTSFSAAYVERVVPTPPALSRVTDCEFPTTHDEVWRADVRHDEPRPAPRKRPRGPRDTCG